MMDTATHCAGDEITNKAVTQGASQCWNVNVHNIYTNKQMDKLLLIIYYSLLSEYSSFIISYDYSPLYQVINSHVKHKIWIKRVVCWSQGDSICLVIRLGIMQLLFHKIHICISTIFLISIISLNIYALPLP